MLTKTVRLRFISPTQLYLYLQEVNDSLDWFVQCSTGTNAGDGKIMVSGGGSELALPFNIRRYGSISVLEIIIEDQGKGTDDIAKKLYDLTARVLTLM